MPPLRPHLHSLLHKTPGAGGKRAIREREREWGRWDCCVAVADSLPSRSTGLVIPGRARHHSALGPAHDGGCSRIIDTVSGGLAGVGPPVRLNRAPAVCRGSEGRVRAPPCSTPMPPQADTRWTKPKKLLARFVVGGKKKLEELSGFSSLPVPVPRSVRSMPCIRSEAARSFALAVHDGEHVWRHEAASAVSAPRCRPNRRARGAGT